MSVDTLSIARDLKAAEAPASQAAAIGRGAGDSLAGAATKADIVAIETKIEQLRSSLVMWFVATNVTMAAIIIAAVKL